MLKVQPVPKLSPQSSSNKKEGRIILRWSRKERGRMARGKGKEDGLQSIEF